MVIMCIHVRAMICKYNTLHCTVLMVECTVMVHTLGVPQSIKICFQLVHENLHARYYMYMYKVCLCCYRNVCGMQRDIVVCRETVHVSRII